MASLGITWWFPVVGETLAEADVCAYNCIVAVNSERWRHCQGVVEEYIPLVMPTVSIAPFLELVRPWVDPISS